MRVLFGCFHPAAEAHHDARRSLRQIIVAQMIGFWSAHRPSKGVELNQDCLRVDRFDVVRRQAKPIALLIRSIERDDVRLPDQTVQGLAPGIRAQVQQCAFLSPVRLQAKDNGIPRIDRRADRLHMDCLGPEPCQSGCNGRPGDHIGQIDHLQIIQPARGLRLFAHVAWRLRQDLRHVVFRVLSSDRRCLRHRPLIKSQPRHVAHLSHGPAIRIVNGQNQPRRECMRVMQPLFGGALRCGRRLRRAKKPVPLMRGFGQKGRLHRR